MGTEKSKQRNREFYEALKRTFTPYERTLLGQAEIVRQEILTMIQRAHKGDDRWALNRMVANNTVALIPTMLRKYGSSPGSVGPNPTPEKHPEDGGLLAPGQEPQPDPQDEQKGDDTP